MQITTEILKDFGACPDPLSHFQETFPSGKADHQTVLDALAKAGRADWARALILKLRKSGIDEKVLFNSALNLLEKERHRDSRP
jgi:pentatricopeptide repeat protein